MFSYIHIPFCESRCKYCRFATIWKTNNILIEKYLLHLKNDIKNFKTDLSTKSVLKWLRSIYFWGWTPSILNPKYLEEIILELKNKFSFQKNIEITLETTPWNVTLDNVKNRENIWINRISIWVQTLNDLALKEIWREGKWSILNALEILKISKSPLLRGKLWKSRGIKNISVDFIIWLPYVKKWETLKDIKFLLKKYPFIKHISVYMLEDYYSELEIRNDKLEINNWFENIYYPWGWRWIWINEEDYLKEYLSIRKYLEKNWFNFYELSNSAKSWYECKHNKSYWNHSNNVWFWLWSHSFLNDTRYAFASDFLWYYAWKLEYSENLSKNDLFLEKVLFSLRTKWIWKVIENKLNKVKIKEFIKSWYLKRLWNKVVLWNKWYSVIDFIIKEII
jgi:oxygen-independent coproporphyrinogen-3 oxidase